MKPYILKLGVIFFLFIINACQTVTNEIPEVFSPRLISQTGEYEFYFVDSSKTVNSIAVTGNFNGWSRDGLLMKKINEVVWSARIKLTPGKTVHYKYIVNNDKWIPDPNSLFITQDQWRNSVLVPINPNEVGLFFSLPMDKGTIIQPTFFTFYFYSPNGDINKRDIRVWLNKEEVSDFSYNEKENKLLIPISSGMNGWVETKIHIKMEESDWETVHQSYVWQEPIAITTPKKNHSGILYEIYVRSFKDTDASGVGDFNGIREKLDYLKTLGVTDIWLMPTNESPLDHGYAITDYYSADMEYGTTEELRKLLIEANKKGIGIWMDFVINHSDSSHPFFKDILKNGKESTYYDWYQMTSDQPLKWKHFGGTVRMPKLNFEHPDVREYFMKVAEFWMDPNGDGKYDDGFSGYRADAAIEVPHEYWKLFRERIKMKNPNFTLLGEVWADQHTILPFFDQEFDANFDYPLYYAMKDMLIHHKPEDFLTTLEFKKNIYPKNSQWITFLSNHDNYRSLSFFNENETLWKQGYTLLYLLPGTPMIYYGDESGMKGKNPPDSNVRLKMEFPEKKNSFYQHLVSLAKFRQSFSVVTESDHITQPTLDVKITNGLLTVSRKNDQQTIIGLFNVSPNEIQVTNELFQLSSTDNTIILEDGQVKVNKIKVEDFILLPGQYKLIQRK